MQITVSQAHHLVSAILAREGVPAEHAAIVADHLVDAAATGEEGDGLARVPALVEGLRARPPARAITIENRGPNAIIVDGGGNDGYVTALIGLDEGIATAAARGFCAVGVRNTWSGGRAGYYVARAARRGLVAFLAAGARDAALGLPADPEPLVVDGGPRDAALVLAMQALALLCGGAGAAQAAADSTYFFLLVDPALPMPRAGLDRLAARARPEPDPGAARRPSTIEVDDRVLATLSRMLGQTTIQGRRGQRCV